MRVGRPREGVVLRAGFFLKSIEFYCSSCAAYLQGMILRSSFTAMCRGALCRRRYR
jgi:hypothetical protein